jgi:proteasome activator subunit 4
LKQARIPKQKDDTYNKIVAKRHAAVLGIAAVVLAFPYDLPKWMPKALVILSESSHDPAPIRTTITETFGEFKRTHQDNWETHKQKFTSDELYVVSELLLSQNYFA